MRSIALKKDGVLTALRYVAVFVISIFVIFFISVASCFIPHEWIKENTIKSVEETVSTIEDFRKNEKPYQTFEVFGDVRNYAMIFYSNNSDPIRSAVEMNYDLVCDSIRECANVMKNNSSDNREQAMISYNRYWQGQSVILHFLTIFGSFLGTRTFLTIIFIVFATFVVFKLYKEDKKLAISFVIGLISINTAFMTRSLEFLPVIFVLLLAVILVLKSRKKENNIGFIFLIMGVLTCYLDFLTCETIVLTVPLITYVYLETKAGKKVGYKRIIQLALLWGIGYAGAFVAKWIISYLFIGGDAIQSIFDNTFGHALKLNVFERFFTPITMSVSKLLPFALFGDFGCVIAIILFVISFVITLRKNKEYLPLYVICLVPLLRFFVISAHSISLNYFTYRALLCAVIVMVLSFSNLIAKNKRKAK